ncbi:MAG TPA: hypothetical protein VGB49_01515, partial [Caulobacteraceae bacterium]
MTPAAIWTARIVEKIGFMRTLPASANETPGYDANPLSPPPRGDDPRPEGMNGTSHGVRFIPASAWPLALAVYAYLAATISAAWVLWNSYRAADRELSVASALLWQGGVYGLWIPVGLTLWWLLRRRTLDGRAVGLAAVASAACVAFHATGAAALDVAFSDRLGWADLGGQALRRLPVDLALLTALLACAAGAEWRRQASEAGRQARALE